MKTYNKNLFYFQEEFEFKGLKESKSSNILNYTEDSGEQYLVFWICK